MPRGRPATRPQDPELRRQIRRQQQQIRRAQKTSNNLIDVQKGFLAETLGRQIALQTDDFITGVTPQSDNIAQVTNPDIGINCDLHRFTQIPRLEQDHEDLAEELRVSPLFPSLRRSGRS
jgi:hypothetical protein